MRECHHHKLHRVIPFPWYLLIIFLFLPGAFLFSSTLPTYVGSDSCKDCHEEQYQRFTKFSKKSRSFELVKKMRKGLTEAEYTQCLTCHTTGYGSDSGFVSEKETPHLADPGCEVCHGPGSVHKESESKADIIAQPTLEQCRRCHAEERIEAFHYSPLLHAGAH